MLSLRKYRNRVATILLALALLMLFTIAIVSPVMGSDHVDGCVKWDDEGNCLEAQAPSNSSLDDAADFESTSIWDD